MIKYNHGTWGVFFLFRCRGSIFPKALVWALPAALLSVGCMYVKIASGYEDEGGGGVAMVAIASFVSILGFLAVFRSNQAWGRFWEGADLLQQARGEWISATSSLFAFCSRDKAKATEVLTMVGQVSRLMSLLYAQAIARLCEGIELERLDIEGLDEGPLSALDTDESSEVKIELILHWIQRIVMDNITSGVVTAPPPIVSRVFNELSGGVVKVASARKMKEIQFPFHYAQMLGVMLLVYTAGAPAICAWIMTTYYGAFASTFLNVFVLWCVNYLSVEIEQPFGDSLNDLPLLSEMRLMNESLKVLASDAARCPPKFSVASKEGFILRTEIFSTKNGGSILATKKRITMMPSRSATTTFSGLVDDDTEKNESCYGSEPEACVEAPSKPEGDGKPMTLKTSFTATFGALPQDDEEESSNGEEVDEVAEKSGDVPQQMEGRTSRTVRFHGDSQADVSPKYFSGVDEFDEDLFKQNRRLAKPNQDPHKACSGSGDRVQPDAVLELLSPGAPISSEYWQVANSPAGREDVPEQQQYVEADDSTGSGPSSTNAPAGPPPPSSPAAALSPSRLAPSLPPAPRAEDPRTVHPPHCVPPPAEASSTPPLPTAKRSMKRAKTDGAIRLVAESTV